MQLKQFYASMNSNVYISFNMLIVLPAYIHLGPVAQSRHARGLLVAMPAAPFPRTSTSGDRYFAGSTGRSAHSQHPPHRTGVPSGEDAGGCEDWQDAHLCEFVAGKHADSVILLCLNS